MNSNKVSISKYLNKILTFILNKTKEFTLIKSLESAIKEQHLNGLVLKLEQVVPDITNQYTAFKVNTRYLKINIRGLHAFQVSLIDKIIREFKNPTIVDIGDSAGTHLQYIIGLYSKNNKDIKCLSVNLDINAIERIKEKGLDAIHARAEELHKYNINTDIFLCLEMLEHLMNPSQFLYELSIKTNAKYLIITVPYLKNSRLGLHHIRRGRKDNVFAENTHIFELSPQDWKLLAKHSGWDIFYEKIYLQYPKKSFLRIAKNIWKQTDFEGFYGMILKRDNTWSSRYLDWQQRF